MDLDIVLNLYLKNGSAKEILEIAKNIEILANQPILEVSEGFKGKKIDYSDACRSILAATICNEKNEEATRYYIFDKARVNGTNNLTVVGNKHYNNQEEIDKLMEESLLRVHSDLSDK